MRKLLISTTALSVALSPFGTLPMYAQSLADDGSVIAPDGTVLCVPTSDLACDLDAIIKEYVAAQALAAEQAAAEAAAVEAEAAAQAEADAAAQAEADAAAQAEADAAAPAEADAAAQAEADAAAQAEADAAAQAEADAAAQAEADAAAQAEADAAAAQAAADAEAAAAAQAEADAAAAEAAAQAEAEAAAQAEAEAAAAAQAAAEAEAAAMAQAQEAQAEADKAAQAAAEALAAGDAEAAALAAALAEEQAADAAAAQAEADAAAAAAATAEAEAAAAAALAESEAAAEAAATAETEAAAEATVEADAAAAEAAAKAATEAEAAAAEAAAADAEVTTDGSETVVVEEGVFEAATGTFIDPEVAAEAVAKAEAELAISATGEMVDPAAGLKVAEPETLAAVEPVDVPEVSASEVESLTELLTLNPTTFDPADLAAAEFVTPPAAAGEAAVVTTTDPVNLINNVTQVITIENVRTSDEEFAAAPVEVSSGQRDRLSDLEKAGLFVLGALVVGAIIKSNNDRRIEESRVVSNTGDRVIVLRPDGTYQVLKDDDTIIRRPGSTVQTETFRDGSIRTIVTRQDGTQVVTIRDATGRVLRRATYDGLGREIVLINDLVREEVVIIRDLPRPETRIIISTKDNDVALKRQLAALEADKAGRKFSLRQIREIREVRALAATIDMEPVTFASGSAAIKADEAKNLADLGEVMKDLLEVNPGEVFLVMGHTDATGKAALNLALSDRRAESVALALTEFFDIPSENMIVQGYGETELLIDTQANEPQNRRVEVKVITPLMKTTYVE